MTLRILSGKHCILSKKYGKYEKGLKKIFSSIIEKSK